MTDCSGARDLCVATIEQALIAFCRSEVAVLDAEDPAQFRAQLLRCDGPDEDEDAEVGGDDAAIAPAHQVLVGISSVSYVRQLALMLDYWHETAANPLRTKLTSAATAATDATEDAAAIEGVTPDAASREQVLGVSVDHVHAFVAAVTCGEGDESSVEAAATLVRHLGGARGLLTLLGFQQTVGSRNVAPLTLRQCLEAFAQPHSPGEALTVGARAFSKHCARSSSGWWGPLKGNDAVKNARAARKVHELLATATWKNVHSLPHGHATMEIRNSLGYGARWDAETHAFRGFLEPQMVNGHETKWRH
ncbi:hypothetical protein BBJ28_00017983 [Nothophytophthora sp. Chile5]|nr:hypothetical protein BBJ28_00017983 [Nothophytophthora sp. Chile5]